MKLLMNTCCAPCSVYCIESLRKEGIEPTLYWYNPNIHPYMEYKLRKDCLEEYSKRINVKVIFEDEYGLDNFCKEAVKNINARCVNYCYPVRLRKTFEYAKENGYDAVTTTLLYSIYQKHEFIKKYMEDLSKEFGIEFLYRDFREGYWEGHEKAIEEGLYMQKYCGCIFSEEEKYLNINSNKTIIPEKFRRKRNSLEVKRIENKEEYMNLLLEGDLEENIKSYLKDSDVYGLKKDNGIISIAVISHIDKNTLELKNLVTKNEFRNKGYAKRLLKSLCGNYKQKYNKMIIGTNGENSPFFIKQGFDNYEKEIDETNVKVNELNYYSKKLK